MKKYFFKVYNKNVTKLSCAKPSTKKILLSLSLIISIFAVYFQLTKYGFVYDDFEYVVRNNNLQNGLNFKSIEWAFFSLDLFNWHPLTWISHIIDCSIYGNNANGHHLTNIIFHTLNSILFFFILLKISNNNTLISIFAAFLFALHPLHTESVAWISERKDVLSTFFGFASIYFYIDYVDYKKFKYYFFAIIFFAFSLMSKAMFVTLPFLFLLFDFFLSHKKNLTPNFIKFSNSSFKIISEKIPFIFLSISVSIITVIAQSKGGAVKDFTVYPFSMRFANSLVSYIKYLYKTVFPKDLAIPYIYNTSISYFFAFFAFLLIVFVTYVFFKLRKKKPYLIFGWLWYLGMLVPVIGIVQVGSQPMADRYSYVPICGIFILSAFYFYDLLKERKKIFISLSISIVSIFGVISFFQAKHWKDPITLFTHTLEVTEKRNGIERINSTAHNNLGVSYLNKGDFKKSIKHNLIILKEKPNDVFALNNIGIAYTKLKMFKKGISFFERALKINYNNANTHNSLGVLFFDSGNYDAAIFHFKKAFELDPTNANLCSNIGGLYANIGKIREAIKYFRMALEIDPNNPNAKSNYARALKYIKK